MPPDTKYVGRPTAWGNPFQVGKEAPLVVKILGEEICPGFETMGYDHHYDSGLYVSHFIRGNPIPDNATAKQLFEGFLMNLKETNLILFSELIVPLRRYKNIACWCGLEHDCHADVWIDFAQRKDTEAAVLCWREKDDLAGKITVTWPMGVENAARWAQNLNKEKPSLHHWHEIL